MGDKIEQYITDDTIFEIARNAQIPFNIWCRIDEEINRKTLEILDKNVHYSQCKLFATYETETGKVIKKYVILAKCRYHSEIGMTNEIVEISDYSNIM